MAPPKRFGINFWQILIIFRMGNIQLLRKENKKVLIFFDFTYHQVALN
jgi:hypothetical protein